MPILKSNTHLIHTHTQRRQGQFSILSMTNVFISFFFISSDFIVAHKHTWTISINLKTIQLNFDTKLSNPSLYAQYAIPIIPRIRMYNEILVDIENAKREKHRVSYLDRKLCASKLIHSKLKHYHLAHIDNGSRYSWYGKCIHRCCHSLVFKEQIEHSNICVCVCVCFIFILIQLGVSGGRTILASTLCIIRICKRNMDGGCCCIYIIICCTIS